MRGEIFIPDKFTTEEDSIIIKFYGKIPIRGIGPEKETLQSKLWGRSESQIEKRIDELGLNGTTLEYLKHFSLEDIEYLKNNYATTSWEEMSFVLGRKKDGIVLKASSLELRRKRNSSWSPEDIEYLKNNYLTMTAGEIGEHLNRKDHSIYHKAQRLGLEKRK